MLSLPAEVTVPMGSLSLAPRKDMRKGTRLISLMALSALLLVSLMGLRMSDQVSS